VRFFILGSHYRSPLDFSNQALQAAEKGLARLHATVKLLRDQLQHAPSGDIPLAVTDMLAQHKERFIEAMSDDFNTSQAIAALFDLNKAVNTLLNAEQKLSAPALQAIDRLYRELGEDVLGLIPEHLSAEAGGDLVDGLLNLLITLRQQARAKKDWATSDAIRNQLAELGVILEDRSDGTIWKLKE
jgi:cysteinyl-tRNA synthetase